MMGFMRGLLAGLGVVLASGAAQATLIDRGGGLIYDDALNITWLQDANYSKTNNDDADGRMGWNAASTWVANLVYHDSIRNVDYSDWRLPSVSPVSGIEFNVISSSSGANDAGYNISAADSPYPGSLASELAYMFYVNLGNKAYFDVSGSLQSGYGLAND